MCKIVEQVKQYVNEFILLFGDKMSRRKKTGEPARRTHEELVDYLYQRLKESGNYQDITKHLEYEHVDGHILGELDLYAVHNQGFAIYFEVKTSSKQRHKARAQFNRWYESKPLLPTKYILVECNPLRIKRYQIYEKTKNYEG